MIKTLTINVLILSLFVVTSCRTPHIQRNSDFAPAKNCDCYVYGSNIVFGGYNSQKSFYKKKTKAKCNKVNFQIIHDSLTTLISKSYDLNELSFDDKLSNDSLDRAIIINDSLIEKYRNNWTYCKIKLRYKKIQYGASDSIVTIKRKINFYRTGFLGKKKIGSAKLVNDSIVKSNIEI